ncbi:MAG: SH3 domain-containing protein [Clostridiales bacterium]|nr:SH3 domain-containing protein [Clostridiales bacterium]
MAIKKKVVEIDDLINEAKEEQEKVGGYRTTQDVNFREGPGLAYNVICVIPEGEVIDVAEFVNGWARCTYGDAIGYLMDCYITAK